MRTSTQVFYYCSLGLLRFGKILFAARPRWPLSCPPFRTVGPTERIASHHVFMACISKSVLAMDAMCFTMRSSSCAPKLVKGLSIPEIPIVRNPAGTYPIELITLRSTCLSASPSGIFWKVQLLRATSLELFHQTVALLWNTSSSSESWRLYA